MSIIRKVRAVERIYDGLSKEIEAFQQASQIHCLTGCGKCCNKADIEASPLEFLPLAFHWFLNHEAEVKLQALQQNSTSICSLYTSSIENLTKGSCEQYAYRGLICRLFGYAAAKDKLGELRLITCKIIKEQQVDHYTKAVELLKKGGEVPIFSDYYKKLLQIDFYWGNQVLPVNKAIEKALEIVLNYYAYRPFPKFKKAS
nr:YkgJ family cysteine cluster protein [Mesonia mobilis]